MPLLERASAMGEHVVLRYTRVFDAPLPAAYAWLTDYQDDDPQRAGHKVIQARPVLERTKDKVVLQGTLEVLGRRASGTATVYLFPPDRWEARFEHGSGKGSVYEYRLTPVGPAQCRLDVVYRIRVRRLRRRLALRVLGFRVLREIGAMWDNFAADMARDLRAAPR